MYLVKYLIQSKNKTIGAVLLDSIGNEFTVNKNIFIRYKGLLENAIVTESGIMRGKGKSLKKKDIDLYAPINIKTVKEMSKVSKYIIMYENVEVLFYDKII